MPKNVNLLGTEHVVNDVVHSVSKETITNLMKLTSYSVTRNIWINGPVKESKGLHITGTQNGKVLIQWHSLLWPKIAKLQLETCHILMCVLLLITDNIKRSKPSKDHSRGGGGVSSTIILNSLPKQLT